MKTTSKSVILISTGCQSGELSRQRAQSELYAKCLEQFGCIGVLDSGCGEVCELAERFDGLILSGGGDIHPKFLNRRSSKHLRNVDEMRDKREFDLLDAFCSRQKPVFGICRGLQVIDVFFGGTLFVQLGHINLHEKTNHTVITSEYGGLREILGERLEVNSYHHQGIRTLGKGLSVTAMSQADGVIEGIEHESLPITAVQWHPERMMEGICMDSEASMKKLWEHFAGLTQKLAV